MDLFFPFLSVIHAFSFISSVIRFFPASYCSHLHFFFICTSVFFLHTSDPVSSLLKFGFPSSLCPSFLSVLSTERAPLCPSQKRNQSCNANEKKHEKTRKKRKKQKKMQTMQIGETLPQKKSFYEKPKRRFFFQYISLALLMLFSSQSFLHVFKRNYEIQMVPNLPSH
jgi:hypothetical protein